MEETKEQLPIKEYTHSESVTLIKESLMAHSQGAKAFAFLIKDGHFARRTMLKYPYTHTYILTGSVEDIGIPNQEGGGNVLVNNDETTIKGIESVWIGDSPRFRLDCLIVGIASLIDSVVFRWDRDRVVTGLKDNKDTSCIDNVLKQADYHKDTIKIYGPKQLNQDNLMEELDNAYKFIPTHEKYTTLVLGRELYRLYHTLLGLNPDLDRPIKYKGMGVACGEFGEDSRFMFVTGGVAINLDLTDTNLVYKETPDNDYTQGTYEYSFKISIDIVDPRSIVVY
jgi:hypothetical protein